MRHDSRTAYACHEYLHKKFAPSRFDLAAIITSDPLPDALKKAGVEHEQDVIAVSYTHLTLPTILRV